MTVFPGPLRFCPVLRCKRFSLALDLLRVFGECKKAFSSSGFLPL
eukprot:08256.XXX_290670_290804_1 [CDS] Oithona nana genome sequencing.